MNRFFLEYEQNKNKVNTKKNCYKEKTTIYNTIYKTTIKYEHNKIFQQ